MFVADARPIPFVVSTTWLAEHLGDPQLRLVDLRSADQYAMGHLQGAVQLDIASLEAVEDGIPFMVAPPAQAEQVLGEAGIGPDTDVVVYDGEGGVEAARLFWTLEYYGHERVALLDGGLFAWMMEKRSLTTETPQVLPAPFVATPHHDRRATAKEVAAAVDSAQVAIVDTRTPDEYVGRRGRDARLGHIPRATNLNWEWHLTPQRTLKDPEALRTLYRERGVVEEQEAITYCRTGHRAAHTYVVLRLLGYPRVRLYDGSWIEWGNRPQYPVEPGV